MTETADPTVEAGSGAESPSNGRRGGRVAPFVALGIAVVMIGLVVLLVGADPDARNRVEQSPIVGRAAPESVAVLGDGTPFDLSQRRGSWVVLNFFQSDCIPCINEHPELIEFVDQQRQLGREGAEFYSVVFGDTQENVEEFFAERGGDWPAIYSDGDSIAVNFGVSQVPETWIINPLGRVEVRFAGEVTAEGLSVVLQQLREAPLR